MIYGNTAIEVAGYLPIDHCGQGIGWVRPKDGQEFVGNPYGYVEEHAAPFIEVYEGGNLLKTVNALDCSEIEFAQKEKP